MAPPAAGGSNLAFSRAESAPVGANQVLYDDFCRHDSEPLDVVVSPAVQSADPNAAMARNRSGSRKSFGSLYRASRSVTGTLWRNSAVSDSISDIHGFDNLREMCGADQSVYIDCDDLKFVKVVGQGAFAGA